jgi:hypothetical protein
MISPRQYLLHFYGAAFTREIAEEFMFLVTELCLGSLDIYTNSKEKLEEAIVQGLPRMSETLLFKILNHVRVCAPCLL